MKFTDENKVLAAQLHHDMKALQQQKGTGSRSEKKKSRVTASDNSSFRGSEERNPSVNAQPQRNKRAHQREWELESVSEMFTYPFLFAVLVSGASALALHHSSLDLDIMNRGCRRSDCWI